MVFNKKKESQDPAEFVARKDYKKAISIYRERVGKQPNNASIRLSLADTLLMDGQADDAVREYKIVGKLYTDEGFLVKAIAICKKLAKLRPNDREVEALLNQLTGNREIPQVEPPMQVVENITPVELVEPVIQLGADAILSEPQPVLEVETRLFKDLSADEFRDIIARLVLRHFEEDTIVVQEGDPGDSLFIVIRGEVRVVTRDKQGKEITLANLGEGEFFGEVSLLTSRPRTATIITNLTSELFELTRKDYDEMIARHPHIKTVMEEFNHQRAYKTVEAMIQSFRQNP